jgi:hypothetical protein
MRRRSLLPYVAGLVVGSVALGAAAARADAPVTAAAAVHRLMAAIRANDRNAYLDALADDYDYNGKKKADIDPFGPFWLLSDHLLYRIVHFLETEPGVATALVDSHFTGRFRLETVGGGQPVVTGSSRLWIEVRRQREGLWRVTAIRPVRVRFVHADTPYTFLERVTVNGRSSVRVEPGAALQVEGESSFALSQLLGIGGTSKTINMNLQLGERWSADFQAPQGPGRYYLDAVSLILAARTDGGVYLSWDEFTVPVVVR